MTVYIKQKMIKENNYKEKQDFRGIFESCCTMILSQCYSLLWFLAKTLLLE